MDSTYKITGAPGCAGGAYGTIFRPSHLGSAGASSRGADIAGGAGGGVIHIIVRDNLVTNGSISAGGEDGTGGSAGGSGGSIFISAGNSISGLGCIITNGYAELLNVIFGINRICSGAGSVWAQNSSYMGGGGSGGRISIHFPQDMAYNGRINAVGGACGNSKALCSGAAGTIFYKNGTDYKVLYVNNGGQKPATSTIRNFWDTQGTITWLTDYELPKYHFDEVRLFGRANIAINSATVSFYKPDVNILF